MSGYERVPIELQERPQWLLWRTHYRDGKPTKIPFSVFGEPAKTNDPNTWATFEEVLERCDDTIQPGFVFTEDDPYCGIDLDACRDPESGAIANWATKIIQAFGSYAELSPSDTGVKIWTRGVWSKSKHKVELPLPKIGDKTPAIEVYDRGRFFAVTGRRLQGMTAIEEGQRQLDELADAHFQEALPAGTDWRCDSAVASRARAYVATMPGAVSGQSGHNKTFHVACVLCHGFELPEAEALGILMEYNQRCEPPWSEKELQHKIRSAMATTGDRGYLRNADPKNYQHIPIPQYRERPKKEQAPATPAPRVTTLEDAAHKFIAKVRNGGEQLIETGIHELDQALEGGLETGELVILAARPSHGKSAIAMQMVHYWTGSGIPCAFISEEMSEISLGKRTTQFASGTPKEHWETRIDAVERDVVEHFRGRAVCQIIEQCRTSEAAVEAIRQAKADHNIRCVVVDYAQLLKSDGKTRYEQVTNTSIALRQAASECNVVLIALAQLSRGVEGRERFIPKLSDLKETGQLEQDADVVVFLVWPHRLDSEQDPHKYQLFVAKNRNRAIVKSAMEVRFEPSRQRVVSGYNPYEETARSF